MEVVSFWRPEGVASRQRTRKEATMTAWKVVPIAVAFVLVVVMAFVWSSEFFIASAMLIFALALMPLFLHTNRPNHRLIVRDRYGLVIAWPAGRTVLVAPLLQSASESFNLGWRQAALQDAEFATLEGLMVRVSVHVAFTVDPERMQGHLRQMLLDQIGDDDARWRDQIERVMRAGVNYLLLQQTYAELMSPHGQADLRHYLAAWMAGMVGDMGVWVGRLTILQVSPSAHLADIIGDAVRRRATTEYIRDQVLPLLPALMPYTRDPLQGLVSISLVDRLSNRELSALALSVSQATAAEDGRQAALPAPRGAAYFPTPAMMRRRQ